MDGWTAILMAAGRGTRMRSSIPKVLHPIAGIPMIGHTVAAARQLSPDSIVVVIAPTDRQAMYAAVGQEFDFVEQHDPLGTGHALGIALDHIPFRCRNILLLNGDMPLISGSDLEGLATMHLKRKAAITVATVKLENVNVDLGILERGARGKAIGVVEAPERKVSMNLSDDAVVGAYALDATWVRGVIERLPVHPSGERYVTDLVSIAVLDGQRVASVETNSVRAAVGVNTRFQLAVAEAAMQERLRGQLMEQGVTMMDPKTVYLHSTVKIAPDAVINPNSTIHGNSDIGERAIIGPNAQVVDSFIGPDAEIGQSVISNSRVEQSAKVGSFSVLRERTVLRSGAYVGTHAEIKASDIGTESRVGHFSYIGDALIGSDVNIGAGAVTCNFDGRDKHVTEIGDGAFIGSGCMLVAPLKIGSRALTGAGSVVTRDVADDERVVGVPARQIALMYGDAWLEHEGGSSLG